jgi:hypothetical protein
MVATAANLHLTRIAAAGGVAHHNSSHWFRKYLCLVVLTIQHAVLLHRHAQRVLGNHILADVAMLAFPMPLGRDQCLQTAAAAAAPDTPRPRLLLLMLPVATINQLLSLSLSYCGTHFSSTVPYVR